MKRKKGQFIILSVAILLTAIFSVFAFFQTNLETSTLLFQPGYSEEANNLFRSVTENSEWVLTDWYNFSKYQVREQVIGKSNDSSSFTVNVNCSDVIVTSDSNTMKNIIKTNLGSSCSVQNDNTEIGDYIYYKITSTSEITDTNNITLGYTDTPLYYTGGILKSKLCEHVSEIYKERLIKLNCSVSIN